MGEGKNILKQTFTIKNELGLHARAAAALAKTAILFTSEIKVEKDGVVANAKSVLGLLTLDASFGTDINVTANGADAAEALSAIADLISNDFGDGAA